MANETPAGPPLSSEPARRFAAEGDALISRGDFAAAVQSYEKAVRLEPQRADHRLKLASAADACGRADLIEPHLLEALRIDPGLAPAHHGLAVHFQRTGSLEAALHHSERALALTPNRPDVALQRARILQAAGQPQAAWQAIEPLVAAGHSDRWLLDLYARLAPAVGREWEALASLERAMRAADLSHAAAGRPLLHFHAAALNDRLGRYDEAFDQARLGNLAVRTTSRPWDPAAHARWIDQKIRYFTPERLGALPRASHGDRRPVLIVGLPRSGTSLIEQILATHPLVAGGGELLDLGRISNASNGAEWTRGEPFPQYLEHLSVRRANELAAPYLSVIDRIGPAAARVTDKMPINFLILEWVELLLPGCRVIHCTRNPLDTCLSCYMTHFAGGNEFKHDLAHLGAFYRDYRRLMDHWARVLPLPMLDVRYEDVVLDLERQVRRMLEFLELPWDARCLRYYENQRRVGTASEDQVRRRVYTTSIGRWKHYESHLGELISALGAAGEPESAGSSSLAKP